MAKIKSKAGSARQQTRASGRKLTEAIQPGYLDSTEDGKTMKNHRFRNNFLRVMKNFNSDTIPRFGLDTAKTDKWLSSQMDEERTGFLTGFVDQASMIQANLHYRMIGSRPLVGRTLNVLNSSEGGEGFRKLIKLTSLNYYTSNLGGAVYLNRSSPVQASYLPDLKKWYWSTPPVDTMFATDPTLFYPNSDYVYPYVYDGEPWSRYDFFKITSMPSTRAETWGVGRCPLWRCIQIMRMTSAMYEYAFNTLSPDTAKGIITLKGMDVQEFMEALKGSESVNEQDGNFKNGYRLSDELGDILVLADHDEEIILKFVTLARLPDGFFFDQWIRWALTSIATNLGFPLEEFTGSPANRLLGQSGAQVDAGVQRGQTKGGAEFSLSLQVAMQANVVPDTVLFQFADRDEQSELQDIEIKQKKVDLITDLFTSTQVTVLNKGDEADDTLLEARGKSGRIITSAEARRLLVEWNVLPTWITDVPHNDITLDDSVYSIEQYRLKEYRELARQQQQIQRLAEQPLNQPVIMYENWIPKEGSRFIEQSREIVLWESDSELTKKEAWPGVGRGDAMYDRGDGSYDTAGPNDYKRRVANKSITLEMALESQHAAAFRRTVRGALLRRIEQLGPTEVSVERYDSLTNLPVKQTELLVSRLYAITQLGKDAILKRKSLADGMLAEIASLNLEFSRQETLRFVGEIDKTMKREIEDTLLIHAPSEGATVVLDRSTEILASLDEFAKILVDDECARVIATAFEAGQNHALDVANLRIQA